MIAGAIDPRLRFRLAPSKRLKYLQAGFTGAAGWAVWLLIAPRLGGSPAAAAAGLTVVWLAWRAGIASMQAPCGLIMHAAGAVKVVDGTRPGRVAQLGGFVHWPGLLALELVHGARVRHPVLVMSDSLDAAQFRALTAWSRRHDRRKDAVF